MDTGSFLAHTPAELLWHSSAQFGAYTVRFSCAGFGVL